MKKFILSFILAFSVVFPSFGQVTTSGTVSAATTTAILTVPASILSLTVFDTSGSANATVLYDLNTTSSTNLVRPSYTGQLNYLTNRVTTWTNTLGVVTSFTNTVMFSGTTTVAATTNEANRVFYTIIPSNSSFTPADSSLPVGVSRGLVIRTVGAAAYRVTYVPQL